MATKKANPYKKGTNAYRNFAAGLSQGTTSSSNRPSYTSRAQEIAYNLTNFASPAVQSKFADQLSRMNDAEIKNLINNTVTNEPSYTNNNAQYQGDITVDPTAGNKAGYKAVTSDGRVAEYVTYPAAFGAEWTAKTPTGEAIFPDGGFTPVTDALSRYKWWIIGGIAALFAYGLIKNRGAK